MEGCPHVRQVQLAIDKSFLNPRTWACCECGTTDSVWACLLCNHVACGRTCSGHALKHFDQTKHPIAVEINNRYIHCYLCDEYVLNDNQSGDIALVQSLLGQVASQHYQESVSRSGRVIKPAATFTRSESRVEQSNSNKADRRYTALCHWRYLLLSRAFNTWKVYVAGIKQERGVLKPPPCPPRTKRKRLLTPGMTGLRNLGNTCYMNAILQSLGHLVYFRECFRQLAPPSSPSFDGSSIFFNRQTTIECFHHISTRPAKRPRIMRQAKQGGLIGGSGGRGRRGRGRSPAMSFQDDEPTPSLCEELHRLMRVMWSGKWAVVTPHAVLNSIWRLIPSFHGYTQQDAQEFLCELLDRLQGELDQCPSTYTIRITSPFRDVAIPHEVLPNLFQGQLVSKVTYRGCGHSSRIEEPFWDLSLDFPKDYQECGSSGHKLLHPHQCSLIELLQKFTETEPLDGQVYLCDTCSKSSRQPQSAEKSLSISSAPDVLRLHLKRFRWSGRNRHKISAHVQFPLSLDIHPFCVPPQPSVPRTVTFQWAPHDYRYSLSSVIIHHGVGFASGHYTCYCWNSEAASWVHCNDARLQRCSVMEVLESQAYILFYARERGKCLDEGREGAGLEDDQEPVTKRTKVDPT